MAFDITDAKHRLEEGFSPWVAELDLSFDEVTETGVIMRMPFTPRLCRAGGIVCGQAFMALADTAAIFGMWAFAGEVRPCTTVDISVQMMRPVSDADVVAQTDVLRLGRSMAFLSVTEFADGDTRPAVHASITLALV